MTIDRVDVAIVGAGIVGLATARALARRFPGRSLAIIERGNGVALAQSGRNSGVLHSGIYYRPGSLKASLCTRGKPALERWCVRHGIPTVPCGKLIVAAHDSEIPALDRLFKRAMANNVRAVRLDADDIPRIEPHARGVGALHVPDTGVVDFALVCRTMAASLRQRGVAIHFNAPTSRVRDEGDHVVVETGLGPIEASLCVCCAGMDADRLARASGADPGVRIVPFVGRYYSLRDDAAHLCKSLIYPVPDPRLPFLGPHFTRRLDGAVEVGPSAMLSLRRKTGASLARDAASILASPSVWALAARHPGAAISELRMSVSRRAFARAAARIVPELRPSHIVRATPGRRAQALAPGGRLVDDFVIVDGERSVHVCNAPSPAATACLAIGEHLVDLIAPRLDA